MAELWFTFIWELRQKQATEGALAVSLAANEQRRERVAVLGIHLHPLSHHAA